MTILQEADSLINGERAQAYGTVSDNFGLIAELFTAYLKAEVPLTIYDVANLMVLVKVARTKSGPGVNAAHYHRDSYVDIAGYAGTAEKGFNEIQGIIDLDVPADDQFFSEHMSQPLTPRVWKSLDDVPKDVDVRSAGGCLWRHYPKPSEDHDEHLSGWMWSSARGDRYDRSGPFTEVVS